MIGVVPLAAEAPLPDGDVSTTSAPSKMAVDALAHAHLRWGHEAAATGS